MNKTGCLNWRFYGTGWDANSAIECVSDGRICKAKWYVVSLQLASGNNNYQAFPSRHLHEFMPVSLRLSRAFATNAEARAWCEGLESKFRDNGRLAFLPQIGQEAEDAARLAATTAAGRDERAINAIKQRSTERPAPAEVKP